MNCPSCHKILITIEYDDFEIDRCFSCSGIWIDSLELEALFENAPLKKEALDSLEFTACSEKDKKCPVCRRKMKKLLSRKTDTVLDQCSSHGIWFDQGELEKVLYTCPDSKPNMLFCMLKSMLSGNIS